MSELAQIQSGVPKPGRFPGLDNLRAAAILLVMVFHLQGYLPAVLAPIGQIGWMGVDLFFVLSGFLIGTQLLRPYSDGKRVSIREFYLRRAYRILPAFLLVLLLYYVLPVWREAPGPTSIWEYLTFTWNLILSGYPDQRAFSHVWSLCVEEHFYLVLPALVVWLMRRPKMSKATVTVAAIVAGGIALRAWLLFHVVRQVPADDDRAWTLFMRWIYYPTDTRLDGLVAGVALAAIRIFRPSWFLAKSGWAKVAGHGTSMLIGGLALVAAALWMFRWDYPNMEETAGIVVGFPVLSAGLGLVVAAATCNRGVIQIRIPGARGLAILAYSLYLTHKAVAHVDRAIFPWMEQSTSWLTAGIYALSCLAVAAALYFAVERPFLMLRARQTLKTRKSAILQEVQTDPAI